MNEALDSLVASIQAAGRDRFGVAPLRAGPGVSADEGLATAPAAATNGWYLDRDGLRSRGVSREAIDAMIVEMAEKPDWMAQVISREDALAAVPRVIAAQEEGWGGEDSDILRRLAHHVDPARSPDYFLILRRGCVLAAPDGGTSSGSVWDYDTHVPLAIMGARFRSGHDPRFVRTVDVAPSLARMLGIEPPEDVHGRPLGSASR